MKSLFEKYIKRECTREEIQRLATYFRDSEDLPDFPTVESVQKLLAEYPDMEDAVADRIYSNIFVPKRKRKRTLMYSAIAAVFVGLLTLGIFYQQGFFSSIDSNTLISKEEYIILELDNGTLRVIDEKGAVQVVETDGTVVGQQNGNELVYGGDEKMAKLVYNTLKVPYGKRFDVKLSDGTVVYLNAGTSLKYPVQFIPGAKRQVFLEGEAYFDVAHDTDHPFVVNAEKLDVTVLGTEFNVSNYPEDSSTDVILVEGSVQLADIETTSNPTYLVPGTKGSFFRNDGKITTKEVVTGTYTAWIEGRLVFRNMPFDHILKKLERHYNVEIENKNQELGQEEFNAGFNNETIEDVLRALKETYGIGYSIENNKAIIE